MKPRSIASVLLCAAFVGGCAAQKSWVYAPDPYREATVGNTKTAVVLPFDDMRENINTNHLLLYMIPLVPYSSATYSVPEGQQMHVTSGLWTNYKPTEDFAKALASELQNAHMFKEVYFDFKKGSSDVVVRGKILSTKYEGTIISYGLSVEGPLLWFLGLPSGTVTNELSVELSCVDSKSDQVLFTKTYNAPPYSKTAWIYVMPSDFNYPAMLKDVYRNFINDLRTHGVTLSGTVRHMLPRS